MDGMTVGRKEGGTQDDRHEEQQEAGCGKKEV